jgi:hypothetical protein
MGEEWTRPMEAISCRCSPKVAERFTHPEISRSGIKVKVQSLCWGPNRNWAEILGVILLVFCRDLASLSVVSRSCSTLSLYKNLVRSSLAAKLMQKAVVTRLGHLVLLEVWARLGGLEAPFVQEMDI